MDYIKKGAIMAIVMTIICGVIYPLATTVVGQLLFPYRANGSIIEFEGREIGSELLGQRFEDDKYFHGRIPSYVNYNMDKDKKASSGSTNLGPTSEELRKRVEKDIKGFLKDNKELKLEDVKSELITESGSGLDPHITKKGAEIQVSRISKATGISKDKLMELIDKNTEGKLFNMYGSERVNVLKLNMEIENLLKNIS